MCDVKFDWDQIDLTFDIELPDFGLPADDAELSVVDDIFDEPELPEEFIPRPERPTIH